MARHVLVGAHLGKVGVLRFGERSVGEEGQRLGDIGGTVVAAGTLGFLVHRTSSLEEGLYRPVDSVGGHGVVGGVQGFHLRIQVLTQSDFLDKVLPLLQSALVSGRTVGVTDGLGKEPTLHFTHARLANAEEVAGFFCLDV